MYLTKDLAIKMESCIKQSHIEMAKLSAQGCVLDLSGGAACFSGVDSFFSQVIGWGFLTKPKQFNIQLQKIEQFYQALNQARIDIELCPLVGNDLPVFLSQRGYQINELNNVSAIDLNDYKYQACSDDFNIKIIGQDEQEEWAKILAIAFGYPEARHQFFQYIQIKGVTAFGAYHNNELIAGATIAIHDDVGDLGVTSTLSLYRSRGLQKILLKTRLNFAKKLGLSLATVTTEPGTISDLNVQKSGFSCAYTRIKLTKLT